MMTIAIPSKGRAHLQLPTMEAIPLNWHERTSIIVYEEEYEAYRSVAPPDMDVVVCPVRGIGPKRQWTVENCHTRGLLMLDDDLSFFSVGPARDPTKSTKFSFYKATESELALAFHKLEKELDSGTAHVSIASREGYMNNVFDSLKGGWLGPRRMLRALGYRVDILKRLAIRFDAMPLMEDFHVCLSLMEAGHQQKTYGMVVNNQAGSNREGGCSTYRTAELQTKAAEMLKARFPNVVDLVTRDTKWGNMESRTDVRIKWARALGSRA